MQHIRQGSFSGGDRKLKRGFKHKAVVWEAQPPKCWKVYFPCKPSKPVYKFTTTWGYHSKLTTIHVEDIPGRPIRSLYNGFM